jgi:uncharacterized protein YifE (UPF0438 family)
MVHVGQSDRPATKHLRVTRHRTFSVCHARKPLPAHALKMGDCLDTSGMRGKVESTARRPATKEDKAYMVVLRGSNGAVHKGL